MPHPLPLTDGELVARLTQTEDSFVERKSQTDKSGWLRTTVAFANSTPIGLPSVLFIGVSDDGQISANVNVEKTLQAFSDHIGAHAWPPIYTVARELTHAGRSCVAVIIPGSAERPHFGGRAFVRVGTQTKDASAEQFTELIASHTSKARYVVEWIGKPVSWIPRHRYSLSEQYRDLNPEWRIVMACNSHWVTLGHGNTVQSVPLYRLELGFDDTQVRPALFFYGDR